MVDVFLDERFIGIVAQQEDLIKKIKEERRKGRLPTTTNVWFNKDLNEVRIEIANGRVRRPVIVVEDGKSKLSDDHIQKLESN